MTSEFKESNIIRTKLFPRLMIVNEGNNKGTIIFFIRNKEGIVVYAPKSSIHKLGEYSDVWNMSSFDDFNGEVTLLN